MRVGFHMQTCSQDTDLSCHVPINSLFVALCDHNPPMLQTDRRTDRPHARSMNVTCIRLWHVALKIAEIFISQSSYNKLQLSSYMATSGTTVECGLTGFACYVVLRQIY